MSLVSVSVLATFPSFSLIHLKNGPIPFVLFATLRPVLYNDDDEEEKKKDDDKI